MSAPNKITQAAIPSFKRGERLGARRLNGLVNALQEQIGPGVPGGAGVAPAGQTFAVNAGTGAVGAFAPVSLESPVVTSDAGLISQLAWNVKPIAEGTASAPAGVCKDPIAIGGAGYVQTSGQAIVSITDATKALLETGGWTVLWEAASSGTRSAIARHSAAATAPSAISQAIAQTAHNLTVVGQVVFYNGTAWVVAGGSGPAGAGYAILAGEWPRGVVSAIADFDNFTVTYHGFISGLTGLTAGQLYYVSNSSGGLTTTPNQRPILQALSATTGLVLAGAPPAEPRFAYLVTKSGHGFARGNVVGIVAGVWVLASMTLGYDRVGLVSDVIDANTFEITIEGVAYITGWTEGDLGYLTATAGQLGVLPATGDLRRAVTYAIDSTRVYVLGVALGSLGHNHGVLGLAGLDPDVVTNIAAGDALVYDGSLFTNVPVALDPSKFRSVPSSVTTTEYASGSGNHTRTQVNYLIVARAAGGGGAGGSTGSGSGAYGGGGGGEGEMIIAQGRWTASGTIAYAVGAGGAGGASNANGSTGGSTSVTGVVAAAGGFGGVSATGIGGVGGRSLSAALTVGAVQELKIPGKRGHRGGIKSIVYSAPSFTSYATYGGSGGGDGTTSSKFSGSGGNGGAAATGGSAGQAGRIDIYEWPDP